MWPSSTRTLLHPSNWIMRVIHHFAEPNIGMVQTRWTHINRHYSFLTEVEAILLDGHFVLENGGLARGSFLQLQRHGGNVAASGPLKRPAWQHDTLTEDTDLLSLPTERMAISLSAGRRVSGGAAG